MITYSLFLFNLDVFTASWIKKAQGKPAFHKPCFNMQILWRGTFAALKMIFLKHEGNNNIYNEGMSG